MIKSCDVPLLQASPCSEAGVGQRLKTLYNSIAIDDHIQKVDFDAVFGTSNESIFDDFDENCDGKINMGEWQSYIEALVSGKGPEILQDAIPYWERRARQMNEERKRSAELQIIANRTAQIAAAERKATEEAMAKLEEVQKQIEENEEKKGQEARVAPAPQP